MIMGERENNVAMSLKFQGLDLFVRCLERVKHRNSINDGLMVIYHGTIRKWIGLQESPGLANNLGVGRLSGFRWWLKQAI